MVDDFIVCVDRIIASACFEAAEGSKAKGGTGSPVDDDGGEEGREPCHQGETIECRICQEEDEERAMEAPCGCSGTLKFAHRKCVQRWCYKKGDIICEICSQAFAPDYSIPRAGPCSDRSTIEIRESWDPRFDLEDPRFLALAVAQQQLLQAEYEDYTVANTGGMTCCRTVAIVLMILLFLRHALMIVTNLGQLQDASISFNVSLLQLAGILLPCYVLMQALYTIQCRRRRQG